jgi:hypothetical protein
MANSKKGISLITNFFWLVKKPACDASEQGAGLITSTHRAPKARIFDFPVFDAGKRKAVF